MTTDLSTLMPSRKPTAERPLLGLTVLVVEDSRYACEAMRLLCLRSGARIRRADCLASARRHLLSYRPTAVVVDLGLPDGSGTDLIREMCNADQRVPVILGISGEDLEVAATDSGADGFLLKPVSSLAVFQQAILDHLPSELHPMGPRTFSEEKISPDPIALRDDLGHIASILSAPVDSDTLDYLSQFLSSLARSADDAILAQAADRIADVRRGKVDAGETLLLVNAVVESRMIGNGPI